jgi:aspartate kinase
VSAAARPLVQKYGGSSVSSPAKIKRVAERVAASVQRGGVVVVVSAMGDTTDRLSRLARRITSSPPAREMDTLLSAGETVTAPLLAMALDSMGVPAISLSGAQAGIRTSHSHTRAHILDVVPTRVIGELETNQVVVVAGFQGVNERLDVTTLGRGGSDTTAVALAAALNARECEINTDVAGIFTADPRIVPEAHLLAAIGYDEMIELASLGAQVMHPRAVEIAELYDLPVRVRGTFDAEAGTLITRDPKMEGKKRVRGIASEEKVAKLTLIGVPDRPGIAASIFTPLAEAGISVDVIIQNVSRDGVTDLSFTVSSSDLTQADTIVKRVARSIKADGVTTDRKVAKVSIVGTGMLGQPGIAARMFRCLAEAEINIDMISTSEIRITCIVARDRAKDAVRALHHAYQLDQ